MFRNSKESFVASEVGIFSPDEMPKDELSAGEIGYIVTGVKEPGIASVGDTITLEKSLLPELAGYARPAPVVFASIYPESQDDLVLRASSFASLAFGFGVYIRRRSFWNSRGCGFRCGFLGHAHLEIITERLRREFNLNLVVTTPSITYEVTLTNGKKQKVYSPPLFPDDGQIKEVEEPWINLKIIAPHGDIGKLSQIIYDHEGK